MLKDQSPFLDERLDVIIPGEDSRVNRFRGKPGQYTETTDAYQTCRFILPCNRAIGQGLRALGLAGDWAIIALVPRPIGSNGEFVVTPTADNPSRVQFASELSKALYLLSFAQPQTTRSRTWYALAKRLLDIVLCALLLIPLLPVMLVVAAAIRLTSPGPAILVQERVGRGGRVFAFYKFRSMYNNVDRSVDEGFARAYINGEASPASQWEGVFKPANDKRVTSIGRLLRKASLDELPQILNVVKGDMSWVGPRPSMPYEVDLYRPWHFRRLEVMPGMTGLAQVRGRSSLTFREIAEIDIAYIEHRSLLLDLQILLRTIPVVLSGRGAR